MILGSRYSTESNCWRTQCRWCFLFMIRNCMIVLLYMHIVPAYTGATLCKHQDHQCNGVTQTKPIAHMLQLPLSELPVAKPVASAKFRVATELGTRCFWIFLSLYQLEHFYTVSLHTACLLRVPPARQSVCFTKLEQSSIILAGLFERNTFGNWLVLSFLDKYLFSLSLISLWFYNFTLLNGVLKSLPRHKLFTTAQPTKARKQSNIRAGNGQLLPRTEWSDLSKYIYCGCFNIFQRPFGACLKCSQVAEEDIQTIQHEEKRILSRALLVRVFCSICALRLRDNKAM